VNMASRLESLTKELGHPLLVSESTLDLLTAPVADLVYVDEIRVRGRSARTRVWGLADTMSTLHASLEGSETA
jgi:class 3 adenylate cyclase